MREGFLVYTRFCKKCHQYFQTIYKNGTVCSDCMDGRGGAKKALILLLPDPEEKKRKINPFEDVDDDPGLF